MSQSAARTGDSPEPTAGDAAMAAEQLEERPPSPDIDITKPHIARIYDYLLGGKHNYAVDRQTAEQVLKVIPDAPLGARLNRRFLIESVRWMVQEAGVRQFLDIGSGLPTQQNVHEVAQAIDPDAKVVYVDIDPLVRVHAEALLATNPNTIFLTGDLREPEELLGRPRTARPPRLHQADRPAPRRRAPLHRGQPAGLRHCQDPLRRPPRRLLPRHLARPQGGVDGSGERGLPARRPQRTATNRGGDPPLLRRPHLRRPRPRPRRGLGSPRTGRTASRRATTAYQSAIPKRCGNCRACAP